MCNDYEQHVKYAEYCRMMQALELGQPTGESARDLPKAEDIRIGEMGPVMHAAGNAIKLTQMKFGFPPGSPRAARCSTSGPRAEISTRASVASSRHSAFFEFTGKKYPKAKHRFTLVDAPFLAIAGLWREGKDGFLHLRC